MHIAIETEFGKEVLSLLDMHLQELAAGSPPESMHALPVAELKADDVTFWCMWQHGSGTDSGTGSGADSGSKGLMGFAALKRLDSLHGELKSMRTHKHHLQSGVASSLLQEILAHAARAGLSRISLETGSASSFAPAQALYRRFGFELCRFLGHELGKK